MTDLTKKAEVDRLGERLRKTLVPCDEDLVLLQRALQMRQAPMEEAATLLRERLGLEPIGRIKTVKTLLEKIRREKSALSGIQDVAGLRVVRDMDLREQDHLVGAICGLFQTCRIVNRRLVPSSGYRAVHVVASVQDTWVEIQVRTHLQHLWADTFEKVADRFGREIRYGGEPDVAGLDEKPARQRQQLVRLLQRVSETIHRHEDVICHELQQNERIWSASDAPLRHRAVAALLIEETKKEHEAFGAKMATMLHDGIGLLLEKMGL